MRAAAVVLIMVIYVIKGGLLKQHRMLSVVVRML